MMASYSQRLIGKRNGIHRWNMDFSNWPSQRHYFSDSFQRHGPEQLDNSDIDEFRLRHGQWRFHNLKFGGVKVLVVIKYYYFA